MYLKLTGLVAALGITAFAVWKTARRDPLTSSETDDDHAAEIIRRMLPALDYAYRLHVARPS